MENSEGVKAKIKRRLLEATSAEELRRIRRELRNEGYNPNSIDVCISELRKKGRLRFDTREMSSLPEVATKKQGETVLPEWVAGTVSQLFDGSERDRSIFIAGMLTPILGMRLFIEGYKPLVEFALAQQKMQLDTLLAMQQGGDIGEKVAGALQPSISELKSAMLASAPNPILATFAQAIQPYITNALQQFLGAFMPKPPPQSSEKTSQAEIERVFDGF